MPSKIARSIDEQIDLLEQRGVTIGDSQKAYHHLYVYVPCSRGWGVFGENSVSLSLLAHGYYCEIAPLARFYYAQRTHRHYERNNYYGVLSAPAPTLSSREPPYFPRGSLVGSPRLPVLSRAQYPSPCLPCSILDCRSLSDVSSSDASSGTGMCYLGCIDLAHRAPLGATAQPDGEGRLSGS